nr:hypothetical protein [Nocardia bhagyanarayanae]
MTLLPTNAFMTTSLTDVATTDITTTAVAVDSATAGTIPLYSTRSGRRGRTDAEPDIGTLVVLLRLPTADRDRTDNDIATPDQARARARHDRRARQVIHLREQRGPCLLQPHQLAAVAVKQRHARRLRRGDTSRQRRRTVHAIEDLKVPAVVDDRDGDPRTQFCGTFAHTGADDSGFVESE